MFKCIQIIQSVHQGKAIVQEKLYAIKVNKIRTGEVRNQNQGLELLKMLTIIKLKNPLNLFSDQC